VCPGDFFPAGCCARESTLLCIAYDGTLDLAIHEETQNSWWNHVSRQLPEAIQGLVVRHLCFTVLDPRDDSPISQALKVPDMTDEPKFGVTIDFTIKGAEPNNKLPPMRGARYVINSTLITPKRNLSNAPTYQGTGGFRTLRKTDAERCSDRVSSTFQLSRAVPKGVE